MPRPGWTIDASDVGLFANELLVHAATVESRSRDVVEHYGTMLWLGVRHHASGHPGPGVITGGYLASIQVHFGSSIEGYSAEVGTDEDRGYALELGYLEEEEDGEATIHHPFPHFRPALAEIEEPFAVAVGALVAV